MKSYEELNDEELKKLYNEVIEEMETRKYTCSCGNNKSEDEEVCLECR